MVSVKQVSVKQCPFFHLLAELARAKGRIPYLASLGKGYNEASGIPPQIGKQGWRVREFVRKRFIEHTDG